MGWINDIKVSFKILILAVIAAVALLSVGYTGYSMLDQANYRMSNMYNQKLKSMQAVDEMKYLMRDLQTHELTLADSKDAEAQQKRSLLSLTGRGYFVVILAKANHEPSTHVLHDIELLKADLEAWGRPIVVLFASADELAHFEARRHEFPNLPATMHFGIDSEGSARNELFGSTLTQGNEWPVVILTDTFNRVVFARQGYTIGIGEQIKQALGKI